ncbi:MAG: hypothetical protein FWD40_10030 [Treponema sp.]|nr:hypothetical protein [Treponema sp.]
MARLKSLNPKSKTFIFTSFGNDKEQNPVKVIFKSFPRLNEIYMIKADNNIFDGIDFSKAADENIKNKIIETIFSAMMENLTKGNYDFKAFFKECIEHFENFEYEQSMIITVDDFWQVLAGVPQAAEKIAMEIYEYAMQKEEFTMGELTA